VIEGVTEGATSTPTSQPTAPASSELSVQEVADAVTAVTIHRPPNNFFDTALIRAIADTFDALTRRGCRAVVLRSEGKHFCAGRDFSKPRDDGDAPEQLYTEAARLLTTELPWVAAVQGAAIGGGLGLALAADFRIGTTRARFAANFSRLGLHHGFGLSELLPRVVGGQAAAELLYTGDRIDGQRAAEIGLLDRLVDEDVLHDEAIAFASRLAAAAPLALRAIRATQRGDLAQRFVRATEHEAAEQARLRATEDFREGIAAAKERREPRWTGR
jgi:enoyl-CoA hydratase/carnithine racemase